MVKSHQKTAALKPLFDEVPPGFLVDAAWLVARNIDRKSIYNYARRGWLEPVIRGLYRRPFPVATTPQVKADWTVPVLSMQRLMLYDVHIGGKTALNLHGYAHYLNLGDREIVFLYGTDIPTWLKRLPTEHVFKTRTRGLFGGDSIRLGLEEFSSSVGTRFSPAQWPLNLSSPERAILELINELPNKESFDNVDKIFQGLTNLRPKRLVELLLQCKSIKVKRLFFVYADRHGHAWRKHLNPNAYNLGSGPRALVEGGQIHPTYQIFVPYQYC